MNRGFIANIMSFRDIGQLLKVSNSENSTEEASFRKSGLIETFFCKILDFF